MTAALTMLVALVTSNIASASTGGEPQPELALFKVASTSGDGTGAVLGNGSLVLAALGTSGATINVCLLHPGDRKCAATVVLRPRSGGDTFGGVAEVLAIGGVTVAVVAEECCHTSGAVVYDSTDGAKTFEAPVFAGNIQSVGGGTYADGQLVVGTYETGSLGVQSFPAHPSSEETNEATPNHHEDGNTYLTTWHSQLLVASDDTNGNTDVEAAAFGTDFNASSSYSKPVIIKNEVVNGISGDAMLTDGGDSLTGGSERLYFWNGKAFGTGHKVPEPTNGDDGYWSMQDAGGVVHVFFLNRRNGYDIYMETTRNGTSWSPLALYHTAITSTDLAPVLAPQGWGLVFECGTGSQPSLAQPILLPQHVHISLQHSTVKVGTSTKLEGTVSPKLTNQLVTLERLSGKAWSTVSTTHESASGKFSFTVPGEARTYRAVVAYKPGEYLYGYSNSATLKTKTT